MTRRSNPAAAPVPLATSRPVLKARGGRIFLRPVATQDAKEFAALHRAGGDHFKFWTPTATTAAKMRAGIEKALRPDTARYAICLKEDSRIIGSVALSQIFFGPLRSAYVGYYVGAAYAKQGYMREALALILRYAFRTLRLNRVEANIQPGNAASTALAWRMGFALEGFSRRYLKIGGGWRDHQRWALLAEDWKPRKIGNPVRPAITHDDIEIRDLGIKDIAGFAVLRHQIAREGMFMMAEPGEIIASKEKFAEQVAHTLKDPLKKRIVARYRSRVAGFISATRGDMNRSRHACHLAIGIAEAFTGQGIGKRLMDALESWARDTGVKRLDLRVMVQNTRAISLYQRCGFAIEGRIRGEFLVDGELVDAYVMGKILS
jgi:ribosomal-protein-alanine N-acetyltransferase